MLVEPHTSINPLNFFKAYVDTIIDRHQPIIKTTSSICACPGFFSFFVVFSWFVEGELRGKRGLGCMMRCDYL